MAASPAIVESAEDAGLRYVADSSPGIHRHPDGSAFAYFTPDGRRVTDGEMLARIQGLAVPPAYRDVWICLDPNGHLQATGKDARGRKQYRNHPHFREVRDQNKFKRMLSFGHALPAIRARVAKDLGHRGMTRDRVLAIVVQLLETSLIRVGNEEYVKENESFGLTTMRNRHVRVAGADIEFHFVGKSKKEHRIEIHDRRLAGLIRKLQELPGQELFQYCDGEGRRESVTSAEVNAYLQGISGEHFTAKDFRTWWGSLLAMAELGAGERPESATGRRRRVASVIRTVASRLGNTPSICRKCYVHPVVVAAFETGDLPAVEPPTREGLAAAEAGLLRLLERWEVPAEDGTRAA